MTNDIKCPKCGSETTLRTVLKGSATGKSFHVCNCYPKCNGRVEDSDHLFKRTSKRGLRWWSILLGVFVTIALVTIAVIVMSQCFPDIAPIVLVLSLLGIEIVCFVTGGLISGAMAGYAGTAHGWRVGFIVAILSLLVNFINGTYSEMTPLSIPGLIFGFVFLIVLSALGGRLGARLRKRRI